MLTLPLIKADAEQRLVYARAAVEEPDKSREIMDYVTARPQFEIWSNQYKDATLGKSLGNIRAMHNPRHLAGVVKQIEYNDTGKSVEVCFKVLDPIDWVKVEEGGYTGLSIGGGYLKKWQDGELTRYTPKISEISLVDSPCIPSARILELQKAEGVIEQVVLKGVPRSFKELLPPPTFGDLRKDALGLLGSTFTPSGVSGYIQRHSAATRARKKAARASLAPSAVNMRARKQEAIIANLQKYGVFNPDPYEPEKTPWMVPGQRPKMKLRPARQRPDMLRSEPHGEMQKAGAMGFAGEPPRPTPPSGSDIAGGFMTMQSDKNKKLRQKLGQVLGRVPTLGKAGAFGPVLSTPEAKAKIRLVLHEHKVGKLRSWRGRNPKTGKPRRGPKVTDRRQAIAIALNQARRLGKIERTNIFETILRKDRVSAISAASDVATGSITAAIQARRQKRKQQHA